MIRRSSLARWHAASLAVAVILGICILPSPSGADWEHYRGPTQNGASAEKLPASLPKDGLKTLWSAKVGTGTSSISVSGDRVFTMGNSDETDTVWCFDAKTGKVLWKYEYPQPLVKRNFEGGDAATPTVDGNRVYSVSHEGDLFCLDAATGKKLWYKHYVQDLGGKRPGWGFAGSPLVEGNLLLCDTGGHGASTTALDKMTGSVVWKSGDDESGYASPVVATLAGKKTVVMFKASHLVGLAVKDGRELWRAEWKTSYDVNAATPLVSGNRILVTSGYGTGCGLFEVSASGVTALWRSKALRSHFTSPVLWQGDVYGIDGDANPKAALVCMDFATGALKWKDKSVNGGALVLDDGKLVILNELGELLIGDASPNGFKPLLRQQVLPKRCWVQPTVANGRIYCRNNDGMVVALGL
jgi:outer membrane protein assembly factor BamB